jgi:hypothetical protein
MFPDSDRMPAISDTRVGLVRAVRANAAGDGPRSLEPGLGSLRGWRAGLVLGSAVRAMAADD